MNTLDTLRIEGLRCRAHHGVYEHERTDGQEFIIDLTISAPLAAAGESDDLSRTIDYGVLAQQVVAAVERDPVDLIETVAVRIADLVLEHPLAVFVTVTVHKPQAPIPVPFGDVSVTLHRGRPERMQPGRQDWAFPIG